MLKQLLIRNFAIIDRLELQFSNGLTVFTGETGAGKSILVDALGLILGDRAEVSIIRPGCRQSEITGIFDITENMQARDLLEQQAIAADEGELIIRRVIGSDSRSRAYINDCPVAAQLLRSLGENLVDIHSQHDHQSLTRLNIQRELLDEYGGYAAASAAVFDLYNEWQESTSRLQELENAGSRDSAISLLQYQVEELEAVKPLPDEYEHIDEEHRRLANATRLLETAQKSYGHLREDEQSIYDALNSLLSELRNLEQFDERLVSINRILDEAGIQVNEACNELRSYINNLDINPERLQYLENRLSDLHDAARKHHIHPQQLFDHLEVLRNRLNDYENNQNLIDELRKKQAQTLLAYRDAAGVLHKARVRSAGKMQKEITRQLHSLGMPDGQLDIRIELLKEGDPRPWGMDQVEFMVNLNPGQSLQPLRKVASGGELSRISLAIKVVARSKKSVPCLVFDEVDAGIGGGVAEIVGKLLHELSDQYQVLCVTHLPQVASQGDNHLVVKKSANKTNTSTQIQELNRGERVEEIARMLGGVRITEQTRKHAQEMLGFTQ